MIRNAIALAALGLVAAPTLAAAAEEASPTPFAGDVGNVIWTLVIFLIVLWVLGKYAWGPLLTTIQNREKFIHNSLANAKRQQEEAEALLAEYRERLAEAHAEATEIVEEARRDAEVVARKVEAEARDESGKMLARAKREIKLATETALDELYNKSAEMAAEIAGKVLERSISPSEHEKLIEQALAEVDEMKAN